MRPEVLIGYRAAMFDSEPALMWLRPGWRGLRLYGRQAKLAIKNGDRVKKALMIDRATQLLTLMGGILDTENGTTLGPLLMTIYSMLHLALLKANCNDDITALDEFELALEALDHDMFNPNPIAEAA